MKYVMIHLVFYCNVKNIIKKPIKYRKRAFGTNTITVFLNTIRYACIYISKSYFLMPTFITAKQELRFPLSTLK